MPAGFAWIRRAAMGLVLAVLAGTGAAADASPAEALPADAPVLVLRADAWCPYNCSPGSERPGYMIEVAEAVFAARGIRVVYRQVPWRRAIEESRREPGSAIVGAIPSDAEGFVFGREPLGSSANTFALRRETAFDYSGPESLSGLRLGAVQDYSYNPTLDAYIAAAAADRERVQLLAGEDVTGQNLRKLMGGRIDLVLDDASVLKSSLAALGLGDKVRLVTASPPAPLYIAFSPADPAAQHLAATLDAGIREMRADGRLTAVLARYGLQDWGSPAAPPSSSTVAVKPAS